MILEVRSFLSPPFFMSVIVFDPFYNSPKKLQRHFYMKQNTFYYYNGHIAYIKKIQQTDNQTTADCLIMDLNKIGLLPW